MSGSRVASARAARTDRPKTCLLVVRRPDKCRRGPGRDEAWSAGLAGPADRRRRHHPDRAPAQRLGMPVAPGRRLPLVRREPVRPDGEPIVDKQFVGTLLRRPTRDRLGEGEIGSFIVSGADRYAFARPARGGSRVLRHDAGLRSRPEDMREWIAHRRRGRDRLHQPLIGSPRTPDAKGQVVRRR